MYSTGRPITIPVSKFSYDAYLAVLNYSARNDYSIDDYTDWICRSPSKTNR